MIKRRLLRDYTGEEGGEPAAGPEGRSGRPSLSHTLRPGVLGLAHVLAAGCGEEGRIHDSIQSVQLQNFTVRHQESQHRVEIEALKPSSALQSPKSQGWLSGRLSPPTPPWDSSDDWMALSAVGTRVGASIRPGRPHDPTVPRASDPASPLPMNVNANSIGRSGDERDPEILS